MFQLQFYSSTTIDALEPFQVSLLVSNIVSLGLSRSNGLQNGDNFDFFYFTHHDQVLNGFSDA